MTWDEIQEWKREQSEKGIYPMVVQPDYVKLVWLGPMRYAMTVRLANGETVLHELGHPAAFGKPR